MGSTTSTRAAHLAYALSIYPSHSLALVTLGDPRSDGRPRRMLAGVRLAVGSDDLVGLTPLDASLKMAEALVEALSAQSVTTLAVTPRRPRRGPQGRPVVLRGQQQLTFD